MSKTVTEKLGKMQIKVSDVEEKKTTLETNAKELVKQIQIKEQEIINLKTDLVRLQGAIAMCQI
jgi:hypothetical protein